MTPEKREEMNSLRERIQKEQDPITFRKLISELNDLLAEKSNRLISTQEKPASTQVRR